ncbi:hypothetical protein [Limimaricola cinnabarinus]|uniref:Uncharacterized protein n=1 Tax=Limimaricola cinnabarinus TaxID=1125964 RepID=A0A2G1MFQ0_9RHOB|nr:hypothetical protein [Limimaricola cinnabarinus]PHP27524.1 hypothetical protein CJ301_10210 [Limimaricola cinnabarinus]
MATLEEAKAELARRNALKAAQAGTALQGEARPSRPGIIEVEIAGGRIFEFPEGTDKATMSAAIQKRLALEEEARAVIARNMTPEEARVRAAARRRRLELEAQAQGAPKEPESSQLGAAVSSLGNGLSFGFMDNLAGALAVPLGGSTDEEGNVSMFDYSTPMAERYGSTVDRIRAQRDEYREDHPWTTIGGDIVGGTATSAAALPVRVGGGLMSAIANMGKVGAAEGAVVGVGNADGRDVLSEGLWGALMGGALGGAAPVAAKGLNAAGRAVVDPVAGMTNGLLGRASAARAARPVARAVERSGMSVDDIERSLADAARDGQSDFVLADALGHSGQRALAGVARQPGQGRTEVANLLEARQRAQGDRMGEFVNDALGVPDTAAQRRASMEASRSRRGNIAYEQARQSARPVNLNGALATIDKTLRRDPILGDSALSQGPLGNRLKALRDRMEKGGEQLIDFNTVMDIRTDLRRQMERNGDVASDLRPLYDQLTAALEASSGRFASANAAYRRSSSAIDAIDTGRAAGQSRTRVADVVPQYQNAPAPEQAAQRSGYGSFMLEGIENARPNINKADPFTTPRHRGLMEAMAADPAQWNRRLARETDMFETRRAALGGSQTADNIADGIDMDNAGIFAALAQNRLGEAIAQVARKGAAAASGMNEETRTLIARTLMSRDAQGALAPLLAEVRKDAQAARNIEAFLRHAGYATADQSK